MNRLLTRYYTNYYHHQLRIRDWEVRVARRLDEEANYAEPIVQKIERWLNYDFKGKRVLVVGAGSGAEAMVLSSRGAEIMGIEPNRKGLDILKLKAQIRGLNPDAFQEGVAEALPYDDGYFDFVFCFTVLEHVQNVEMSLDEMIRVCKEAGTVFIEMPNYKFPYEGHYKMMLIPFGPKWIQSWYLKFRKRPTTFLKTINFLSSPQLDRILWKRDVVTMRIFEPNLLWWSHQRELRVRIRYWFTNIFAVNKDQFIFLRKGSRK